MFKRNLFIGFTGLFFVLVLSQTSQAFTIFTKEEALKTIFGKSAEIVKETQQITGKVRDKILERLGGTLVYTQEGSESGIVDEQATVDFHFATKNGKKYGVAIIEVQPGKWGPVEFIVAMDLKGIVRSVKVMSYYEQRGRPIAQGSFMRQYKGKSGKSQLIVGKDIIGVSGATISSRAATFTVKKAITLYEEFYSNK